jgi:hypothetical protein
MKEYLIPEKISFVRLRNAGLIDVRVCFHGDDPGSYVVVDRMSSLPVFTVRGGVTNLVFESPEGDSELELLMWG